MKRKIFDLLGAICILLFIASSVSIVWRLESALANQPNNISVYDGSGKPLGKIRGNEVYDANGHRLGYTTNGKTYNNSGQTVATPEVPGILFCRH